MNQQRRAQESLLPAVEAEVALFCTVEQDFQKQKIALGRPYREASLHARAANCGIATAFLQQTLHEYHNISTDRLYGEPPRAPRLEHGNRIFGHVILQHDTIIIDPTYGQLFSFVGMTPQQADTTERQYPENLALIIDPDDDNTTIQMLAASLERASQLNHVRHSSYAPLRSVGRQVLQATLSDIYDLRHYSRHDANPHDATYDHLQILLHMAEQSRP